MAFYNRRIAKNKTLRKAWCAGHHMKLDANEETCLPEICGEIARWMRRERAPRNRLSLRSFSVLLCGAIRLYRDEVDNLLSDTLNFNSISRGTTPSNILKTVDQDVLPPESSDYSEEESFVLMPRIIKPREIIRNNTKEINTASPESSQDVQSDDDEDNNISDDESTVFTVPSDDKKCTPEPIERREQGLQTSPCVDEPERDADIQQRFDPNLPFAYIIVHDNYNSRIPSKIFFSSLNENVKFMTKS